MAALRLIVVIACTLLWVLRNVVDAERALSAGDARLATAAAPPPGGTVYTVQELPSSNQVDGKTTSSKTQDHLSSYEIFQIWRQNERCPFGTIPILRKDPSKPVHTKHTSYVAKNKDSQKNIREQSSNDAKYSNHEYAVATYQPTRTTIYGASVTLNQWNPLVELDYEFSLSQMWITAGQFERNDLNTIEVGWQVFPDLYHDRATRLFIYWTADYYNKTGCYNLQCPGFVQVDNTIMLGGALKLSSTYEGKQVELPQILVSKDPQTHNWWLRYGTKYLGYWPQEIFTHLANYGESVQWGGEVINSSPGGFHTSTQMGSGHFADDGYQGACYAHGLARIDSTHTLRNISIKSLTTFSTNPGCYNIKIQSFTNWATSFFFGGPGKNPNCT